tara:strand:+ start:755 stop:1351 length:597 start_codon:yes stop_codon:yes gene_type:complete
MKLIFISGPSGSGKTTLSKQILLKIKNGIVLNTDNYYKTDLKSKIYSKFIRGYFDRSISFNYKLLKKDFNLIVDKGISVYDRSYNFKNRSTKKILNKKKNIEIVIVEGIFAKEFSNKVYNKKIFFLEIKTDKNECMTRILKRDLKERGKEINQAKKDFIRSWDIYYEKFNNRSIKRNKNEFIITKKTNIDNLLKKIIN